MNAHENATLAGAPRGWAAAPQDPPWSFRPDSAEARLLALLAAETARVEHRDGGEDPDEAADGASPGCVPLALEPDHRAATRACKRRTLPVETAIIERHRRRESSVEEVLLALYHAGTSLGGIERICEALWGARISPATISELSKRASAQIATSLGRGELGVFPYVFLSALAIRRSCGAEVDEVSVVVAVGVDGAGFRSLLGVRAAAQPGDDQWHRLLHDLAARGATGVRLFIGDADPGMRAAVAAVFPGAAFQQCVMGFCRSVAALVPAPEQRAVTAMLKAMHASEDRAAARAKAARVVARLENLQLAAAAAQVKARVEDTFNFYGFPGQHWHSLQSANRIEKILRDIRERARVVGAFSDDESAAVMVAARFRALAAGAWRRKGFMNMTRLERDSASDRPRDDEAPGALANRAS